MPSATAPTITAARPWLRALLYRLTLVVAAGLGLLVLCAPILPSADLSLLETMRQLFAQDSTLRKTTVAGAMGLWVTGVVFFRPRVFPA